MLLIWLKILRSTSLDNEETAKVSVKIADAMNVPLLVVTSARKNWKASELSFLEDKFVNIDGRIMKIINSYPDVQNHEQAKKQLEELKLRPPKSERKDSTNTGSGDDYTNRLQGASVDERYNPF